MSPPFHQFMKHLEKDEGGSHKVSLDGLMLFYKTWTTRPTHPNALFDLLTVHLGTPIQGGRTSPPEKIVWAGWKLSSSSTHSKDF